MNPNFCFSARIVNNVSSCILPRISDQRFAMHSDSLHTYNNWNNWFHFQYDRLWPVNMTGKTKSWLVNSPISPDIVRWPAVISSPERPLCHLLVQQRSKTKINKRWRLFPHRWNNSYIRLLAVCLKSAPMFSCALTRLKIHHHISIIVHQHIRVCIRAMRAMQSIEDWH